MMKTLLLLAIFAVVAFTGASLLIVYGWGINGAFFHKPTVVFTMLEERLDDPLSKSSLAVYSSGDITLGGKLLETRRARRGVSPETVSLTFKDGQDRGLFGLFFVNRAFCAEKFSGSIVTTFGWLSKTVQFTACPENDAPQIQEFRILLLERFTEEKIQ